MFVVIPGVKRFFWKKPIFCVESEIIEAHVIYIQEDNRVDHLYYIGNACPTCLPQNVRLHPDHSHRRAVLINFMTAYRYYDMYIALHIVAGDELFPESQQPESHLLEPNPPLAECFCVAFTNISEVKFSCGRRVGNWECRWLLRQ